MFVTIDTYGYEIEFNGEIIESGNSKDPKEVSARVEAWGKILTEEELKEMAAK